MPKRSFKTDKRRREIAKRKKREEKLQRKRTKGEGEGEGQDLSYLEYLYPGGIPDDVAAEHGLLDNDEDSEEDSESDE